MSALTALQRDFINRYQGGFALAERPYAVLAEQLGCTEARLLQAIADLLERGLLSRFGPIYNAHCLGGGLTLAAMQVPEADFDRVAECVNALPQVAHNYRRDHALNMWFVVATDQPDGVAATLDRIREQTGLAVLNFPKQREFYLGLWLRLGEHGDIATVPVPTPVPAPAPASSSSSSSAYLPEPLDRRLIALTQRGLPLRPRPYAKLAREAGCSTAELIERLRQMLASGAIRRIGAVPNHYRLGLRANGMSVWDLPTHRLAELGPQVGALSWVSHCYERPRHRPLWRYNLFAMVHGRERGEVQAKVAQLAALLGDDLRDHQVLLSSAILKKTGLRLAA